jgi:hypothetical protein
MHSCYSTCTTCNLFMLVDNGASRHTTYGRKLFSKLQKKKGGMRVELHDDVVVDCNFMRHPPDRSPLD